MTPDRYSRRYLSNHELRQSLYPSDYHWGWTAAKFLLLLGATAVMVWGYR